MKKLSIILTALLLSACVNLSFDSFEYDQYIRIEEIADSAMLLCGTPEVNKEITSLKKLMDHQYIYATNREARPQVAEATRNLKSIVDSLYARYQKETPSKGYCQEKLRNVSLGSSTVIRALGRL